MTFLQRWAFFLKLAKRSALKRNESLKVMKRSALKRNVSLKLSEAQHNKTQRVSEISEAQRHLRNVFFKSGIFFETVLPFCSANKTRAPFYHTNKFRPKIMLFTKKKFALRFRVLFLNFLPKIVP